MEEGKKLVVLEEQVKHLYKGQPVFETPLLSSPFCAGWLEQ